MPLHAHADDLLAAVVGQHRRRKDALPPRGPTAATQHRAPHHPPPCDAPISWPLFVFIVCQQLPPPPPPPPPPHPLPLPLSFSTPFLFHYRPVSVFVSVELCYYIPFFGLLNSTAGRLDERQCWVSHFYFSPQFYLKFTWEFRPVSFVCFAGQQVAAART